MALSGSFEDIAFAELLQLLNVGHKSGRLHVWRGEERAELFLTSGEIAWARMRFERGPEIVYRVLGWQAGEFSFERTNEPAIREIRETTEALILEGMKRYDEWSRVEADMPDMHVVLRQCASAVNEHFEDLSPEMQQVLRLVNARRDVATIVRESGLEPLAALNAVMELRARGVVEDWAGQAGETPVIQAKDRLPEAQSGIRAVQTSPARRAIDL